MTYDDARRRQARQRLERDYRAGRTTPHPARVTQALDVRNLYGPDVDIACGVVEPAVDEWEAGRLIPTWEQLVMLAWLTDFPVEFFFRAPEPVSSATICVRSGKGRGCHTVITEVVPRAQDLADALPMRTREASS